jgi:hypothetical protein
MNVTVCPFFIVISAGEKEKSLISTTMASALSESSLEADGVADASADGDGIAGFDGFAGLADGEATSCSALCEALAEADGSADGSADGDAACEFAGEADASCDGDAELSSLPAEVDALDAAAGLLSFLEPHAASARSNATTINAANPLDVSRFIVRLSFLS